MTSLGGGALRCPPRPTEQRLHGLEGLGGHEGIVDGALRPDPLALVVPANLGLMAEADVLDVDQYLVTALAVPHLVAGVAGVGEDGTHRRLRPCSTAPDPVRVALRIVC